MRSLLSNIPAKFTGIARLVFLVLLTSIMQHSFAQVDSTYNNYTGIWNDNASWATGPSPVTTNLTNTTDIYGYITLTGDLTYGLFGTLNVIDTLVIVLLLRFPIDLVHV